MADRDQLAQAAVELRGLAKEGLRQARFSRLLERLDDSDVLGSLPAVQAAGTDAAARLEYLIQAINDAIDELGGETIGAGDRLNGNAQDGDALRALFGFTSHGRQISWRVRQEAAAHVLHISWDHFRNRLQPQMLRALAQRILAKAAHQADGEPLAVSTWPGGLTAFPSQREIEHATLAYIRNARPRSATMLELSTATTGSIVRALRDVRCSITLLTARPSGSEPSWQNERLRRSLADLRDEHMDYAGLRWKMYRVPASLRGRTLGSVVMLGWYTYRDNVRLPPEHAASVEVWGHDNAMVVADAESANGRMLSTWFHREFDRLWEHRLTRSAEDVDLT
jgi:hypothetical protein